MPTILKLSFENNDPVFVNFDLVREFYREYEEAALTRLTYDVEDWTFVKETPDEIMALLKEAKPSEVLLNEFNKTIDEAETYRLAYKAAKNPWDFSHDELAKFMRDYEESSEKHGYYESLVSALRKLFKSRVEHFKWQEREALKPHDAQEAK